MKKHLFLTLALAAAALFSLPRTAAAIPLLSVVPSFQSGNIGDLFSVDLVISNLGGEEVGSFDIDLTYNSTILSGQSITLGNGLGDPGNPLETFPVAASFAGGVADISEISFLDESTLQGLQGSSFTLATLSFQGSANGLSPLTITQSVVANGDLNTQSLTVNLETGAIQVGDLAPVPEPTTLLLVGTGTALAALRRRRRRG